jgi:hypothetical protein
MNDENLGKEPQEKVSTDNFTFLELDRRRELKFSLKGLKMLEQAYEHEFIPSLEDPESCEYCGQKKKQSGICAMPMLEFFDFISRRITSNQISTDDIYKLIWAGLIRDDAELTLERTEELLEMSDYHLGTLHELIATIFVSIGESTPEAKDKLLKKTKSVTLTTVRKRAKTGAGASSSTQQ